MKNNLTVLITCFNRSRFVERSLIYYASAKFDGDIILADGSDPAEAKETVELVTRFKESTDLNLRYISCPNSDMAAALVSCLKNIETDYAVACPDDDLILVEGLEKGITFLTENHDYIGFTGKSYRMQIPNDDVYFDEFQLSDFRGYLLYSDEGDDELDRVKNFILNPAAFIFNVVRTSAFKESFSRTIDLGSYARNYIFGEILQGALVLQSGKVKRFDFDYCVRQTYLDPRLSFYSRMDPLLFLRTGEITSAYLIFERYISELGARSPNSNGQSKYSDEVLRGFFSRIFLEFSKKLLPSSEKELQKSSIQKISSRSMQSLLRSFLSRVIRFFRTTFVPEKECSSSLSLYAEAIRGRAALNLRR